MANPIIQKNNVSPKLNWRDQLDYLRQNKPITENPSSISSPIKNEIVPIISPIKTEKKLATPKSIKIDDSRRVRATTGKPMNPNRDYKTGIYPTKTAVDIIRASKERGVDPWTSLAVGHVETGLGKMDEENPGHIFPGQEHFKETRSAVDDLVYTLDQKKKYARKLGYKDEEHQIQAYNGLGKINRYGSDSPQNSYYGVPIPPGGVIDFKKTPLYGKEVIDIRDNILKKNKDLQNMVDTVGSKQKLTINPSSGDYINMNPSNKIATNVANWLNKYNKK